MNTITKIGAVLVAVIVIGGAVYFLAAPGGSTDVVLGPGTDELGVAPKDVDAPAVTTGVAETGQATGSVDDIAAALDAELAAEIAGIAAFDAAVASDVAAINSLTNTTDLAGYENF